MPRTPFHSVFADTGGTFTDSFLLDADGHFEVGKAPTTPGRLDRGFFESVEDAGRHRGASLADVVGESLHIGYASTTVINTVLTRTGLRVGLIVTHGFEHLLLMQRGVQTYTEYDPIDRLHPRTHRPVDPLVGQGRVVGVTERIDSLGQVIVPLYGSEVDRAADRLLAEDLDAICVVLLYSWKNPVHELIVGKRLDEKARSAGKAIAIYLSHEVSPIGRELPRANDTVIEAYTRPLMVKTLRAIEQRLREHGYRHGLHVMQSTGGVTGVDSLKAIHTLESGPVGGVMGGLSVGRLYDLKNLVTTDVGGTSFDVGVITDGEVEIEQEPVCARMVLGVPMVSVYSVGAGGGTIARIDPLTGRLEVGPASAGADPGPAAYGRGGLDPTVTDADLVLGYLNPENFLGGRIALDPDLARQAIEKKIAGPLGLSVEDAATGINTIIDVRMRDSIVGLVTAQGLDLSDYHVLAFGGAGPSHAASYTDGLPIRGVLLFPYSSVFCAFGAACSDYVRNYTQGANLVAPGDADDALKATLAKELAGLWADLARQALADTSTGDAGSVQLEYRARMRFGRQLDQILVRSPLGRGQMEGAADWDRLVEAFQQTYSARYSKSGMYPRAGYEVVEVSLVATAPRTKPKLPSYPLSASKEPLARALQGRRRAYFAQAWLDTPVYRWEDILPGNELAGPAIMEHATQTLVLPPGRSIRVDEYLTVWMTAGVSA